MKKIYIFSGVSLDRTPIIREFINHYSPKFEIKAIEYVHKKRISFTFKVFLKLISTKRCIYIFVGSQLYPFLFLLNRSKRDVIFWALETYSVTDDKSFLSRLNRLEKYINWKNKRLFIPTEERLKFNKKIYKSISIVPNTPRRGLPFYKRELQNEIIKLVIYGNLDNKLIYLNEWINFVNNYKYFHLTLIGKLDNINTSHNISRIPSLNHKDLIKELKNYHFSIVGYRPVSFNYEYCAPNKLYESLSLSLPVIVNHHNPTIKNIINKFNAGIVLDFSNMNANILRSIDNEYYSLLNKTAYATYQDHLYLEKYLDDIIFLKNQ